MRAYAVHLITVAAVAAIAIAGTAAARGPGDDSFILEQGDQIIVEAQGCHAECQNLGTRRVCRVKNGFDCQAVCRTVPECKPNGLRALQVCAVLKDPSRF